MSLGSILVAIARERIAKDLEVAFTEKPVSRDDPALRVLKATFVTLRHDGKLRGCRGSLAPTKPLEQDIEQNAHAALIDPRFKKLSPDEFWTAEVEISVLSGFRSVMAPTQEAALELIRPGTDGVYLQLGDKGATFLPYVWKQYPEPKQFFDALRKKAGIPAEAWRSIRVTCYTTASWSSRYEA